MTELRLIANICMKQNIKTDKNVKCMNRCVCVCVCVCVCACVCVCVCTMYVTQDSNVGSPQTLKPSYAYDIIYTMALG